MRLWNRRFIKNIKNVYKNGVASAMPFRRFWKTSEKPIFAIPEKRIKMISERISMKKNKPLIIAGVCMAALFVIIAIYLKITGRKPFKDLDETDIVSAAVTLSPPDKTIVISEFGELAGCLNDVVICSQDNSYTEYDGQGVIFTITTTDGTQTDVMAYNPFLVIDGVGYKTKYGPCQALSSYANKLLQGYE